MVIRLYHGTSSANAKSIILNGATKLYLTIDDEQADYYAKIASEEDGSEPVILVVSVTEEQLCADLPSFNEPLSYILNNHNVNEDEWFEKIKNGGIIYPKIKDWKTSLKYTKTVLAIGKISPSQITLDGDLYEEDLLLIESAIIS